MTIKTLIKLSVAVVLIFSAFVSSYAKTDTGRSLSFAVVDSLDSGPVVGAVAELLGEDGRLKAYATTGNDGSAVLDNVENGKYTIRLSMLGYETCSFRIEKTSDVFDAGTFIMKSSPMTIDAAVHVEESIRSSQNGDTISYNAASYKVIIGADTESLVSKMPGIVMTETGVNAHGQDVRKITLNGKDFFGNDVVTALKNIPADMVKEIEVVNSKSDIAELTGVDDGDTYTAINIVTKPETRNGMLSGKVYGGYGYSDKYIAGTGLNWFGDDCALSVLGMSNNMNRYNFMSGDITGGDDNSSAGKTFRLKELPGISDVHSAGVNFSNEWITGTYFFGCIDNGNESENHRRRAESDSKELLTDYTTGSHARNYSHNFSSKITIAPSGSHSFIIRPTLNIQDNTSGSLQKTMYSNLFSDGSSEFLRNRLTDASSDKWALAASLRLSYRYKFLKKGRTLSLSGGVTYNDGRTSSTNGQYTFLDPDSEIEPDFADSYSSQLKDYFSGRLRADGTLAYTEPVSRRSRLTLELKAAYDRSSADNKVFLHDKDKGTYGDTPDPRQSALNTSSFLTAGANVRYNYYFRKVALTASAGFQNVRFNGNVTVPYAASSSKDFRDAVYRIVANIPVNKSHTVRLEARSRTSNPSASRLQNVVNLANMSNIRAGNPDLEPSYLNDLNARYVFTDAKSGSTFSVSASYSFSNNYVADSLVVDSPGFVVTEGVALDEGDQFVKPVNMRGYSRIRADLTCGVPLKFLRSNLGITAGTSVSRLPSMVNGAYSPVKRDWYTLGISFNSNISERVDFSLGYTARANLNEQITKAGRIDNNFMVHRATAFVKVIFWKGFTFTGNLVWRQNKSLDARFDDSACLYDLYIGKRLFRNNLGEISIGVTDLFDDNALKFTHSIGTSGTSDGTYLSLGRLFIVNFVYDIRWRRK